MCFHTRDAVARDESSFTFEMPGDRLRAPASKVALASCEFPMVQWTVEEEWCRFYMNEGIHVTDQNNHLSFSVDGKTYDVFVPLRVNTIKAVNGNKITTKFPHGLKSYDGVVKLLGSHKGDILLEEFIVKSETVFQTNSPIPSDVKFLHVPTISGPTQFASILNAKMKFEHGKVNVAFDASNDTFLMTFHFDTSPHKLHIINTCLAVQCGLSTILMNVPTNTFVLPSEPTRFWDYVEMPRGFYAPCHRPMCTGQPLRFTQELESAVNRFYFPLGSQGEYKGITPHLVIFTDPGGHLLTCPIPCGRYTPIQLCAHLETEMTRAAQETAPDTSFAVGFEDDRFRFSCERRIDGRVYPVNFELLFHHPMSIDGSRLGFANQPHSGSSCYVSSSTTKSCKAFGKHVSNIIRVGEVSCQKRFRFHSTHPPPMIGVVMGKTKDGAIEVRTHINKFPFAHGLQEGDIINLSVMSSGTKVVAMDENGVALKEVSIDVSSARIPSLCSCVVLSGVTDPCVLRFTPPASCDGISEENTGINIHCEVEPWNMAFCKPSSIQAHMLGFPPKVIEWGIDGSVGNEVGHRLPPFDAPFTHCLDHPDYVLMTFSESSGASLEHMFNGQNKQVFCKLSLYPLFREERMLPRDTTLLSSQVSRFTLAFWNPDMKTPYKFHGAQFSFSLSFVGTKPE